MRTTFLAAGALLAALSGLAAMPAQAEGGYARHHARVLPPHVPYRDPRFVAPRRQAPDFLIQAYLPRPTNKPIYNEPPPRFPSW